MANWLITGISSGFGRELARAAIGRGDTVIGTVRQAAQIKGFEEIAPGRAHAVLLDVTRPADIEPAVRQAIARAGHIDVLVNNAGYGLFGAIEEISDAEARRVMDTNFFGALSVIRALLPHLRERRAGHIVNVASVAGVIGFPACGLYSASKFALEGMSESLAAEVAAFGIRVTIVEPGGLRTNFSGGSLQQAECEVAAYAGTPAQIMRAGVGRYSGSESGDPAKAAAALIAALEAPTPPLRLALGADAVAMLSGAYDSRQKQLAEWLNVSNSTAFDKVN